jgi:hypothetical protein
MLAIVIAFHPRPCGSFSSSDYPSSLWQPLLPAIARGAGGSDRCHRNQRSLIGHEIARRRSRNRNRLVARGPPLASSSAKQTSAPSRPPKNYCFRSDGGADCAARSGRIRHRRPARTAAGTAAGTAEVTAMLQRLGQADNVVRLSIVKTQPTWPVPRKLALAWPTMVLISLPADTVRRRI